MYKIILYILVFYPIPRVKPTQEPIVSQGIAFMQERPLLLSGNSWKIGVDVHVNSYRETLKTFIDNVNYVQTFGEFRFTKITEPNAAELADKTREIINQECAMLRGRADGVLEQLEQLIYTLAPVKRRGERSLVNLGGYFLHYLFGTGDTDTFNEINARIENLNNTNQAVVHLMENQITFINDSYYTGHRNEKSISTLTEAVKILSTNIYDLEKHFQEGRHNTTMFLLDSLKMTTLFRGFLGTIVSIQQSVNMLETALTATASKKLSPFFVTPGKMLSLLTAIQPNLPAENSLLTNLILTDMYQYYSLCTVHAAIVGDRIRLYITVPIKTQNKFFYTYRALPLKSKLGNHSAALMYKPEFDYLAVTPDNQLYLELNNLDLDQCTDGSIRICPPTKQIRKATSQSCLYSLYIGSTEQAKKLCPVEVVLDFKPEFNRPTIGEKWVYSVDKEEVTIICPGEQNEPATKYAAHTLQGTGKLHIPSTCKGVGTHFLLDSHSTTTLSTIKSPNIMLPKLGNMIAMFNTSEQGTGGTNAPILGNHDQISKLLDSIRVKANPPQTIPIADWQRQIEDIQRPTWREYTSSPWFHSSYIGLIAILSFTFLICKRHAIWERCCQRTSTRRLQETPMVQFTAIPTAPTAPQPMAIAQGPFRDGKNANAPGVYYVAATATAGPRETQDQPW